MTHRTTLIGLGVMGQRMLRNMHRYGGLEAIAAWDPNPATVRKVGELYPSLQLCDSARSALCDHDTEVVYIACPPNYHYEHAMAAFNLSKAVFCEKPLGVDIETSRELTARARESGLVNIVNYSLASAPAATELERQFRGGALGDVLGVDLRLHFAQWPEVWQIDAAEWLDHPAQGGFVREVVSHWIFLTQRLFGQGRVVDAWIRYPSTGRSETHMHAALEFESAPLTIAGGVGGGPDLFEYTVWGSRRSARILDWGELYTTEGGDWRRQLSDIAEPREEGYRRQLENAARAIVREPHPIPDFAAALSVQRLIETIVNW